MNEDTEELLETELELGDRVDPTGEELNTAEEDGVVVVGLLLLLEEAEVEELRLELWLDVEDRLEPELLLLLLEVEEPELES